MCFSHKSQPTQFERGEIPFLMWEGDRCGMWRTLHHEKPGAEPPNLTEKKNTAWFYLLQGSCWRPPPRGAASRLPLPGLKCYSQNIQKGSPCSKAKWKCLTSCPGNAVQEAPPPRPQHLHQAGLAHLKQVLVRTLFRCARISRKC